MLLLLTPPAPSTAWLPETVVSFSVAIPAFPTPPPKRAAVFPYTTVRVSVMIAPSGQFETPPVLSPGVVSGDSCCRQPPFCRPLQMPPPKRIATLSDLSLSVTTRIPFRSLRRRRRGPRYSPSPCDRQCERSSLSMPPPSSGVEPAVTVKPISSAVTPSGIENIRETRSPSGALAGCERRCAASVDD